MLQDAFAARHHIVCFTEPSRDFFRSRLVGEALLPLKPFHSSNVFRELVIEQKRHNYDIWVSHSLEPALAPFVYAAARMLGVPIVQCLHNYSLSCTNGYFMNHGESCQRCAQGNFWPAFTTGCWRDSRLLSGCRGMILQKMRHDDVFRQVRRWVTSSETQRNVHIRIGLPASRVDVVPHYVIGDHLSPAPAPHGNVLYHGRLSTEQGVDVLLRAWGLLARHTRELLIAGTGPDEDRLKELAAQLQLDNVRWLGLVPRHQHPDLWAQAAFSIVPSIWPEPSSLSLLESWKNRRPVVASRIGAMAEVLAHGRGGLLADPGVAEDLAQKIQIYFEQPMLVVQAGQEGHEILLKEYNQELWVERFEKTLERSLDPNAERDSRIDRKSGEVFHACTLFDSGFLAKGLALHASLKRQGTPFCLHVFAMDDFAADYLEQLSDPTLFVVRKAQFEDTDLLRVKKERTRSEYYWTCASSALLYCMEKIGLPKCTYLDADIFFYAPPQLLEAEMGDKSIGITPHNYAAAYDQNRLHGVYCVQYVTIRNDERGLLALRWWRDRCIEWCHARVEQGRFGDQKYLDDWPERFTGVRVLDGPGIGLAPWNCRNYEIRPREPQGWNCRDLSDGAEGRLIFFHFHEMRFYPGDRIKLVAGGYQIPRAVREELYRPYIRELLRIADEIKSLHPESNPLAVASPDFVKMIGAKAYARFNPAFVDHYLSLREALGD
jgi:glycosyltransferase involved in cell wall biosynthesis